MKAKLIRKYDIKLNRKDFLTIEKAVDDVGETLEEIVFVFSDVDGRFISLSFKTDQEEGKNES